MDQGIKVKGMYRVQIRNEDGTLAGDSGWNKNTVTNLGIQNYLAGAVFANTGSKQVNYVGVGTGGTVATDATALPGEVMGSTKRVTISKVYSSRTVSNGSGTQYCYGTFDAGFITTAATLANIGLFAASDSSDVMFAGNTFNSSACATNQAVQITYQIQLG